MRKPIKSAGQRAAARLEKVLAEKSLTLKNSPFMGALAKTLVALYLPKQIMNKFQRIGTAHNQKGGHSFKSGRPSRCETAACPCAVSCLTGSAFE